jgi:hypothetical protein
MRKPFCIFLVVFTTTPAILSGQSGGRLPRVLEVPASTRAMALGDAFMMGSGHADAIFYHPALLADASGFGLDIENWTETATAATASAAMPWLGGGIGIGLQTLQYDVGAEGAARLPPGQDVLFSGGTAHTSERVASVGYARRAFGIRFGVVGKLVEERVEAARDATAAVDVGAATDVGPLTVGLTAANLGPDMAFSGETTPLPTRVTLGAGAYGRPLGPLDVGMAAALTRRDDGTLLAGAGVELGYWPVVGRTFVARFGVQRVPEGEGSPLTVGLAFWGDDLVLEWAYRDFGGLGAGTHRFGVRWR